MKAAEIIMKITNESAGINNEIAYESARINNENRAMKALE